jgi:hypothetical protein
LRRFPRDVRSLVEPTLRPRQRVVGPPAPAVSSLSVDTLFDARYDTIVSRAIDDPRAENREKQQEKQNHPVVDSVRSKRF